MQSPIVYRMYLQYQESTSYQLGIRDGRTDCPTVVWLCVAKYTRTDVPNDTLYSQDTKFKINPLTQPKSDSKQRLSTAQARDNNRGQIERMT